MGLSVETARTEEERARLFEFRYRVYVEEMEIDTPEADHERRWLRDPLDDTSTSFVLVRDGEVVGALRVTLLEEASDATSLVSKFEMQPAIDAFGKAPICTTSRFMLDPKLRHGTAILRLMRAGFEEAYRRGVRLNYGDCSPHLVPFYEHLGFRRYASAFNDTAYGFKVPILMLLGDRERFERVRSPLARLAAEYPDDAPARAWFERSYPDRLDIETAALLPEGEFFEILSARIANDPLHSVGLLHGLDRDEAERFLARATIVRAAPGDRIVRQGEPGETMFVILSGVAEAIRDESPDRVLRVLGPGDPFGEIGFLTTGIRSASVVARTPCEVVVVSGEAMRAFLAREPGIAAKVLLNLSRMLAERLSDLTPRAVEPR